MVSRALLLSLLFVLFCHTTNAQDFDIQRYEVSVQLQPAANTAQVQARLALVNITTQGRSGQIVTLKLNKNAKVAAVKVDGADAQFRQKNDERLNELANISIDFPKSVQPGATAQVALNYSLEFKESSSIATIMPGETVLLPESFWVPFVHTPFAAYGPDISPVTISVAVGEGERAISDGQRRSGSPSGFEQSLPAQPLLLSGNYDEPIEIKARSTTFEFIYPRGIGPNAQKQAEALAAEGGQILDYYSQSLGFSPPQRIRIASSSRVSSYVVGTTLVLSEDPFPA